MTRTPPPPSCVRRVDDTSLPLITPTTPSTLPRTLTRTQPRTRMHVHTSSLLPLPHQLCGHLCPDPRAGYHRVQQGRRQAHQPEGHPGGQWLPRQRRGPLRPGRPQRLPRSAPVYVSVCARACACAHMHQRVKARVSARACMRARVSSMRLPTTHARTHTHTRTIRTHALFRFSMHAGKGHGLISETAYDDIVKLCPDWNNESPACSNALNDAANSIGDIDIYYL